MRTRPVGVIGRRGRMLVGVASVLAVGACGLPGDGVRRVDDAAVPYRLLEAEGPVPTDSPTTGAPARSEPLLFWLDAAERLAPTSADASCDEPTEEQVVRLLEAVASGPSEQERAEGRTSAWARPTRLELVDLDGTTVVVALDPRSVTSADRLPLAVGQIVMSVASARGVDEVLFVADGEPVQVPLPGGALTSGPVTSLDYARLVAGGGPSPDDRWPGCR